ncbi:MAG: type II toxin-antitoxin system antitoxin [Bacteroidota bacterium]
MSEKKKFLLRLDDQLYTALEKWAADDLRSVNAQIEFLLKEIVRKAGRTRGTENHENTEQ